MDAAKKQKASSLILDLLIEESTWFCFLGSTAEPLPNNQLPQTTGLRCWVVLFSRWVLLSREEYIVSSCDRLTATSRRAVELIYNFHRFNFLPKSLKSEGRGHSGVFIAYFVQFLEEEGMCIAVWLWQSDPRFPLLLLLNRDELHDRPTKPIHWWDNSSQILGGKDCLAGGTWMACKRDGRIAFLTNVMEPNPFLDAKSRGNLPLRYLESQKSSLDFAEEVAAEADQYNGFNLILVDISSKSMVYVCNRPRGESVSVQHVLPGLHVLSNARLDSPWHKAQRLGKNFIQLLSKYGNEELPKKEMVEKLMRDSVKAERARLPNTGLDSEWELNLSSIFVDVESKRGRYGTRSTAALSVKTDGEVSIYETYLEKGVWKDHTFSFQIQEA